ncbi:hypothetical protein FOA52_001045 [Chlamydomonas sp. UWO 241]|nr:hypothetical protein FOA52_001045 [Chlamydomonas sp. UWO 241]
MGGPTGHGQKNKAHKAGGKAGLSARKKQRLGKEVVPLRGSGGKGSSQGGKAERYLASKQSRDTKRQELLERKRKGGAPLVIAVLPLSDDVDLPALWATLIAACGSSESGGAGTSASADASARSMDDDAMAVAGRAPAQPLGMTTVAVAGARTRGVRLTLLPPASDRADLLHVVDVARAAEVLLLAVPGAEGASAVDGSGECALSVLRAMGLPALMVCVQGGGAEGASTSAPVSMKDRSAAKKRAEKAFGSHLAGEHRAFHVDSVGDCAQLLRHILESPPQPPLWRRARPQVIVEGAEFVADSADDSGGASGSGVGDAGSSGGGAVTGTLALRGYVRAAGLSANQAIHLPGVGDFQIDRIEAAPPSLSSQPGSGAGAGQRGRPGAGGGGAGGSGVDMEEGDGPGAVLLAAHDPETREDLTRENNGEGDEEGIGGEQTWPSEAELADVEAMMGAGKARRRRLPEGTSDYQAAWILDDENGESDDDEDGSEHDAPMGVDEDEQPEMAPLQDDDGVSVMDEDESDAGAGGMSKDEARRVARQARLDAEKDHEEHPDEVDVPVGTAARQRFQKYRGLKSFRSSPWDAKEWLPAEYARVFAFENFKRAARRARTLAEHATSGADPCAVPAGDQMVILYVVGVPTEAAMKLLARVSASVAPPQSAVLPPLVAFGLLQHEAKLSVVHFSLTKARAYSEPIKSKDEVLLCTGVRSFVARPVFSADNPGDKHKMETFLQDGAHGIASVYAPISYGPLPTLAFKLPAPGTTGCAELAAIGTVRGTDPDRVVLKKITLTGYPVRVHKGSCTVRFMFHTPDDIRWFRPVELYTKGGRRGRITAPIGTHGAMKCLFDGPVQQNDVVCMSLYKRTFPKWPASMAFA